MNEPAWLERVRALWRRWQEQYPAVFRLMRPAALLICVTVLVISEWQLASYLMDYHRAGTDAAQLQQVYRAAQETPQPVIDQPQEAPTAQPGRVADGGSMLKPLAPSETYDPFGGYPDNPYRQIAPVFTELRRSNKDICAWITIGTQLDMAVVQRNNTYYIDHDYEGRKNVNGALFLDEQISLSFRPDTYIVYGHNMKTGAMLGFLHKYDSVAFLRRNPLIVFNTLYEEGTYAVFADAVISLQYGAVNNVDYESLLSASKVRRQSVLEKLKSLSQVKVPLEVSAEDQVLLLVTCTGDDSERRILAARRLREGETESSLTMTYLMASEQ